MKSNVSAGQKRVIAASIITVLFCASQIFPYSFSAWTSMTGAKTFAVTPFFYLSPIGSSDEDMDISADAVVGYGFTDKIDIFANIATLNLKSDPGSFSSTWLMPRYDLGGNNIVAAQLGLASDYNNDLKFFGGPHYHYFWENDNWGFEANVMALFFTDSLTSNYAYSCIAPVYKLVPKILYPYVEIDPSYTFGDEGGFDFTIAPGVFLGIPDTPHQLSISVPISGIKDGEVSVGISAWYWWSFSLGGEEK